MSLLRLLLLLLPLSGPLKIVLWQQKTLPNFSGCVGHAGGACAEDSDCHSAAAVVVAVVVVVSVVVVVVVGVVLFVLVGAGHC